MCKQKNIENLEGRLCALQNKYKGRTIVHKEIILDSEELALITRKEGVIYYGILTCGVETPAELTLWGSSFEVTANSQIIEMFQVIDITIGVGDSCWFSGYEITIQGL